MWVSGTRPNYTAMGTGQIFLAGQFPAVLGCGVRRTVRGITLKPASAGAFYDAFIFSSGILDISAQIFFVGSAGFLMDVTASILAMGLALLVIFFCAVVVTFTGFLSGVSCGAMKFTTSSERFSS